MEQVEIVFFREVKAMLAEYLLFGCNCQEQKIIRALVPLDGSPLGQDANVP